ncbi:MAG TPA: dienelactone hydrolase family protein [Thermomicrobiales bacterium]|nr:dienelactone hydrolase family protein [Thermomicrobiales bacterium]
MTVTAQALTEDVLIPRRRRSAEPLAAYLARPADEGPHPAVVVIHELYGLNDNIRDFARRFADVGYLALAVDLFSGGGNRNLCILRVMSALMIRPLNNKGLSDLRRSIDWLQQRPDVDADRVGAIGFCMGGGYALALACVERDLRASSAFYCFNPRPLSAIGRACPIIGSYPGKDWSARSGRKLDAALDEFNVPHDIKIYPGASHSFFNDTLDSHHPEAAADAWQRTLAFFDDHMGSVD